MKHLGLLFLLLSFVSCDEKNLETMYYIYPAEIEIQADYTGIQRRVAISSNCDWSISNVPQWCTVQKLVEGNKEYLKITVLPNDKKALRDASVALSFNNITSLLHISQSGVSEEATLQWYTLPVNFYTDIQYTISEDNNSRIYQFTGEEIFVNPSLRNQIFLGNLIDGYTNNFLKLTSYYDKYTFNPVTISCNNGKVRELQKPSLVGMSEFAQEIINDLPRQNNQFIYSSPLQYSSYRQLYLLGFGNLGLKLDELISGEPYLNKEMTKRTGMIYSYSYKLFNIVMDYPEKLIDEKPDEIDMRYINSIAYGKTALLLIETDDSFAEAKNVVHKIMKGENLTSSEYQVKKDFDVYYIYFDNTGKIQIEKGNDVLIKKYVQGINNLAIMPLSFSINKLSNNSIGNLVIELVLP